MVEARANIERTSRAAPRVDPRIIAIAGDVARPERVVPFHRDLRHLPGQSGLVAGARSIVGMIRHGEAYMTSLARRWGPVFRCASGHTPMVCVADADLLWTVLRNEEGIWSSALPWTFYFGGLNDSPTGDGPLMLDFDFHRDARRLLQPAFGATAIRGYLESAVDLYEREIDRWLRRGRVRFKAEVRRLFARVSAKIFMGIDDPEEAERLDVAMMQGWMAFRAVFKRSRMSPAWRQARRGMGTLWSTFRPRMEQRRSGAAGEDLLSRMAQTEDGAAWLDHDARMRLFIAVMFGAFDTTASGSASMAYLLTTHTDWQERLRREAGAASIDRATTPAALKALEEHEWVWKETLRMFPVGGQLSRMALSDTRLGDHEIPSATLVWLLAGTVANDPAHWTEPSRFDPERFSPARAEDKKHKAIFLPFGAGAHACIGAQLATAEIKAFWHALLSRARFRLSSPYRARHGYLPIGIVSGNVELDIERV